MLGNREERTQGLRSQAQDMILQAYDRGFKAGQKEAEERAERAAHPTAYGYDVEDVLKLSRLLMVAGVQPSEVSMFIRSAERLAETLHEVMIKDLEYSVARFIVKAEVEP